MIISMRLHATKQEIDQFASAIANSAIKVHSIEARSGS